MGLEEKYIRVIIKGDYELEIKWGWSTVVDGEEVKGRQTLPHKVLPCWDFRVEALNYKMGLIHFQFKIQGVKC